MSLLRRALSSVGYHWHSLAWRQIECASALQRLEER